MEICHEEVICTGKQYVISSPLATRFISEK
jgi:hypothetical protein